MALSNPNILPRAHLQISFHSGPLVPAETEQANNPWAGAQGQGKHPLSCYAQVALGDMGVTLNFLVASLKTLKTNKEHQSL